MKRISFLMMALLLMGGIAMAQGTRKGGDRQMDPKERATRMTERMVKEYALSESQRKQLLEANLAMLEQMKPSEGAQSTMRKGKKEATCQATDSCCKKEVQKEGKRAGRKERNGAPKMTKEDREAMFQQMKTSRDAYDAQLKKILTKEQYDAYTQKQAERQKKMQEGRRNR